jgi:hypothetical protein
MDAQQWTQDRTIAGAHDRKARPHRAFGDGVDVSMQARRLKDTMFGMPAMAALLLAAIPLASGADAQDLTVLRALDHGTLIVWVVRPANQMRPKSDTPVFAASQPGFHEATTSALGQNAGGFGQNAGSYGVDASSTTISAPSSPTAVNARQPGDTTAAGSGYTEQASGSFGQSSGGFGQNAGGYGQTTGSLGQNAGSAGQTAGTYGQTLTGFGDSLSTLGQPRKTSAPPFRLATRGASSNLFEQQLHSAFPDLKVLYSDVYASELTADLSAAAAAHSSPDVLIGALTGAGWQKAESRYGAAEVRRADFVPDGLSSGDDAPEYAAVAGAPHADAARAFIVWAGEMRGGCVQCGVRSTNGELSAAEQKASLAAIAAMGKVLEGVALGAAADPAMTAWPAMLGLNVLQYGPGDSRGDGAQVGVVRCSVNGALAAVTLRVSAAGVYGAVHPLIVLRRTAGANGVWRVLQVSLNLPSAEAEGARAALTTDTAPVAAAEQHAGVLGVTLRAPDNGSQMQPEPKLGWDNGGGAGLEVVEWQSCATGSCGDSHLYFVPDHNQRLRTEATAEFARADGNYRWRLWSVGAAGAVKLSPWRTFVVIH